MMRNFKWEFVIWKITWRNRWILTLTTWNKSRQLIFSKLRNVRVIKLQSSLVWWQWTVMQKKLTRGFKNDIWNWQWKLVNFAQSSQGVQMLKICTLMGFFCPKYVMLHSRYTFSEALCDGTGGVMQSFAKTNGRLFKIIYVNMRISCEGKYIKLWKTGLLRTWNLQSRSIEERACENFWGQLKRSRIFRGVHKKFMWNFHGSWFLTFEIRRGFAKLCIISMVKACFLWNFKV